jgi:hypothetical protein
MLQKHPEVDVLVAVYYAQEKSEPLPLLALNGMLWWKKGTILPAKAV